MPALVGNAGGPQNEADTAGAALLAIRKMPLLSAVTPIEENRFGKQFASCIRHDRPAGSRQMASRRGRHRAQRGKPLVLEDNRRQRRCALFSRTGMGEPLGAFGSV